MTHTSVLRSVFALAGALLLAFSPFSCLHLPSRATKNSSLQRPLGQKAAVSTSRRMSMDSPMATW